MTENNIILPKENIPKVEEVRVLDIKEESQFTKFLNLFISPVQCMNEEKNKARKMVLELDWQWLKI